MFRSAIFLAVVTLVTALTACSTTVPGTAVPEALHLDTGNFPTVPRTVRAATPADAWQQESWNIGDYVVAPWDIDPSFSRTVATALQRTPLVFAPTMLVDDEISASQAAKLVDAGLQAGFRARSADTDEGRHAIGTGILRFSQPDTAASAIRIMTSSPAPDIPAALGAIQGTVVLKSTTDSSGTTIVTATMRENLVILADVTGMPNAQHAIALLVKAIHLQVDKAEGYRQTPYIGGFPEVDMDPQAIMARTMPAEQPYDVRLKQAVGLSAGVEYLAGFRSMHTDALYAGAVPDNAAGLEWVGSPGGTVANKVVKASNSATANQFRAQYGTDTSCAPDLPADAVSCDKDDTSGGILRCTVSYGSWVAMLDSNTKPLLRQKCAAQYLILRTAGP
jgi:hypothetical protein